MSKLLSTGQVSRILGVSVDTIRAWSDNGKLVPNEVTASGKRLYDPETIAKFREESFFNDVMIYSVPVAGLLRTLNHALRDLDPTENVDLKFVKNSLHNICSISVMRRGNVGEHRVPVEWRVHCLPFSLEDLNREIDADRDPRQ